MTRAFSLVAAVLWLIAVTGINAWFAHPKRLSVAEQKRSVAASLYACAPLAWITPLTIFAAIIYWTVPNNVDGGFIMIAFTLCGGGAILLIPVTPIACWIVTALLIRRATHSNIRAVVTLVSLPILWLILAVVIFLSSHILVNFTALLIHWFR